MIVTALSPAAYEKACRLPLSLPLSYPLVDIEPDFMGELDPNEFLFEDTGTTRGAGA